MARDNEVDLNILDLSIFTLFVVLYALLLNIQYLSVNRVQLLDLINNTNFADEYPDVTEVPKGASTLYLISTTIFVYIAWYEIFLAQNDEEASEEQIQITIDSFIGVYFIVYGSIVNYFTAQKRWETKHSS